MCNEVVEGMVFALVIELNERGLERKIRFVEILRGSSLDDDLFFGIFDSFGDQSDYFFDRSFQRKVELKQSLTTETITITNIKFLSTLQISENTIEKNENNENILYRK